MFNGKNRSGYGRQIQKLKKIRSIAVVFVACLAVAACVLVVSRVKNGSGNEKRELLRVWNIGNFKQAYEISKNALSSRPVDYFLLTTHGFSAYQLGISQINNHNTLIFINDCIRSLRKALLLKDSTEDGRVCYVLGKAYSYKGTEYADLAVKYLETAKQTYDAQDIPEYLGLAYAACGDYRSSVEAFSQSFIPGKTPSDSLLLSIARSYMAMEESNMAIGYLQRCIDTSPDSKSITVARYLLAENLKTSGDYDGAENQYLCILDETGENAEVHYQLGELYNMKGDTTRARSEWRIAYRQDPSHAKARARLNI